MTTSAAAELGDHDVDLVKLLESSNKLARNLLECLNKAKALGRFRRWKSLRQAVKSVSSKGEFDDMANRLSMYRAQFQSRVLSSLRCVICFLQISALDQLTYSLVGESIKLRMTSKRRLPVLGT